MFQSAFSSVEMGPLAARQVTAAYSCSHWSENQLQEISGGGSQKEEEEGDFSCVGTERKAFDVGREQVGSSK